LSCLSASASFLSCAASGSAASINPNAIAGTAEPRRAPIDSFQAQNRLKFRHNFSSAQDTRYSSSLFRVSAATPPDFLESVRLGCLRRNCHDLSSLFSLR
jgi:hypothetical protein